MSIPAVGELRELSASFAMGVCGGKRSLRLVRSAGWKKEDCGSALDQGENEVLLIQGFSQCSRGALLVWK